MPDPTAMAAATGAPAAACTLRAVAVIVAVCTLVTGPPALSATTPLTSSRVGAQEAAVDGESVEGSVASAAQVLAMVSVCFVGTAVDVATSAVPYAALVLSPVVLARRFVAGGGVLRVPVSVEASNPVCVDMAPWEANDCTWATVGEAVSAAVEVATGFGEAVGIVVAEAGTVVGVAIAVGVATLTGVAVGAIFVTGRVVAGGVGEGGGEGDDKGDDTSVGTGAIGGGMPRVGDMAVGN
jgi:hypothetical protein